MAGIKQIKWILMILTVITMETKTDANMFIDTTVLADSTDYNTIQTDHNTIQTRQADIQSDQLERLTKRMDTLESLRSDDAAHLKELSELRKSDAHVITLLSHEVEELQRLRVEDLRLATIQNQRIRELERQCIQYEDTMHGTSKAGLTPPDREMSYYNRSNVKLSSRDDSTHDNFHNDTSYVYDNLAFHAILSSTLSNPGDNRVVIFDRLITNAGGVRYSTNTGIFTCTKPGLHVFSWSIYVSNNQYIYTDLVRNGAVLGSADTGQNTDFSMSGSATVATHLEVGDEVWVRVTAHKDGSDIYPSLSMFTGFRVH